MRSPSATASLRRLSTTTPAPSPRTYPSAAAAKVLHRPSLASRRARQKLIVTSGIRITLTPPASASRQSPCRRLRQARWTATSDEEQAVSIDRHGPCRPSTYDRRPAATLNELPVPT